MLTPEYLNNCADDIIELYSRLDEKITRDIARRIVKTGFLTDSAKHQIEVTKNAGKLYDEVISQISSYTGKSKAAVKAIFKDAGIKSVSFDNEIYKEAGLLPKPLNLSPSALKVLNNGIKKTEGLLLNLTKTTANTAHKAYIEACSIAELQITSGAFDYNTAIRNAVNDAISSGAEVTYPKTGHKDKLDVAVRRAVLTGVSQTTGEISLAYANDLGTDLMEINAHSGARPSHAVWQGKIVCISGKRKGYLTLKDIGYGTGAGFKGWNCRHDWYPYIEGVSKRVYTDKKLDEIKNKTIDYNGITLSQYDAEQIQRSMERKIRDGRRKLAGYDEAIKASDSDELSMNLKVEFDKTAKKLKENEKAYKAFCGKTGLTPYNERLQKSKFNRSVSQKVVASSKEIIYK